MTKQILGCKFVTKPSGRLLFAVACCSRLPFAGPTFGRTFRGDICIDIWSDIFIDIGTDIFIDVWADICIDIRADIFIDIWADIFASHLLLTFGRRSGLSEGGRE